MRILLVEGNAAYAKLIIKLLDALYRGQAKVLHCTTLEEGLGTVQIVQLDVILLDLHLPDSKGLKSLLDMLALADSLPIIVLSGIDDEDMALQAVTAGAEDYLIKGQTDPTFLKRAIRYAMERKAQKMRIRASEERLASIINLAQDAIISADEHYRIILFNPAAEALFKRDRMEVIGEDLELLLPTRVRSPHRNHIKAFTHSPIPAQLMHQRGEVYGLRRDGTEFPAEVTISKLKQGDHVIFTAVIRDITERKHSEDLLRDLATIDPLTGAYNRRQFFDLAEREYERSRRHSLNLSLAIFDLDDFKRFNKNFGHAVGDTALKRLVQLFQTELRPSDILGRSGGEEFVLLLPQTDLTNACRILERLRRLLQEKPMMASLGQTPSHPFPEAQETTFEKAPTALTISVGISALGPQTLGIPNLISEAEMALEKAKSQGGNAVEMAYLLPSQSEN